MFASYPLFSNVMIETCQKDTEASIPVFWLLEAWCGCGASYASAPMFASYPLFSNVMITFILPDGGAAWPGIGFSCFSLFGSWGLLCDGFSVSDLPCSALLLFAQGTWESMALGFMTQFLIVFSTLC